MKPEKQQPESSIIPKKSSVATAFIAGGARVFDTIYSFFESTTSKQLKRQNRRLIEKVRANLDALESQANKLDELEEEIMQQREEFQSMKRVHQLRSCKIQRVDTHDELFEIQDEVKDSLQQKNKPDHPAQSTKQLLSKQLCIPMTNSIFARRQLTKNKINELLKKTRESLNDVDEQRAALEETMSQLLADQEEFRREVKM